MRGRKLNLADAAARAAPKPADVVRNLEQADCDGFEMTTRFNHRVFSSLRFEMIFRLVKRDAGTLFQMPQHFAWKIDMPIQTCAHRSSTERKLAQSLDRFLRPFFGVCNLLRIAGKFLTEAYRRRVHQVGSADLDDLPKFLRFVFDRGM